MVGVMQWQVNESHGVGAIPRDCCCNIAITLIIERNLMPPQSALPRQPYLLHQVCEPRVRTQWAERKVSLETLHLEFPLAVGGIEPDECLVFIAKLGVEKGNFEWRCIAALALLEPGLDAFLHRRFPASRLKTLRQRIRKLRLGGAAQVLSIEF